MFFQHLSNEDFGSLCRLLTLFVPHLKTFKIREDLTIVPFAIQSKICLKLKKNQLSQVNHGYGRIFPQPARKTNEKNYKALENRNSQKVSDTENI